MGIIKIGALSLERGKGYRIITEEQLRERASLASKSKWLDMVRKYGGKKLKVYDFDPVTKRVWMSEDKSDTFVWKPFFLADYVESRDKPIIDGYNAKKVEPAAETSKPYRRPTLDELKATAKRPTPTAPKVLAKKNGNDVRKLVRLMLLANLMQQAQGS